MDRNEVTTKAQLVAALKASAHDNYTDARRHPFEIKLGTTTYTFGAGLHTQRLSKILRNMGAMPASAFAQDARGNA